jgi:hypothetical protein
MVMRILDSLNRFRQYLRGRPRRQRPEKDVRRLTLEALEDRLALSTATFGGSTLDIVASPGTTTTARTILLQVDSIDHAKVDVKDSGTLLGQFPIASISSVSVQVAGNDTIKVDDSNGFPFASGTGIALFGSGSSNSLVLQGTQAINADELFIAGTSTQNGLLKLGGSTFGFTSAIAKVTDDVPNNTSVQVQTTAQAVSLAGPPKSVTETLSGLAGPGGGGNTFTFREKANVDLQLRGDNATATLNATQAAHGLQSFTVEQFGKNDTVDVNATPSFVGNPTGGTFIDDPGTQDQVHLRASAGPVFIFGTSSTTVVLGSNDSDFSKSVTAGINGLVSIHNVGVLDIEDAGNVTTSENVAVTESSITGTGLFGPGGSVQYSSFLPNHLSPAIFTGQLANTYTVTTSSPFASFNGAGFPSILIDDASTTAGLSVTVDLTVFSDLQLSLLSKDAAASSLFISAPAGTLFSPFVPNTPEGFEQAFVPGATHSDGTFYNGFDSVHHS